MSEPAENEAELNYYYILGQSSGLEEAGGLMMQHAIKAFQSHDKTASMLRTLADGFKASAKERHPGPDAPNDGKVKGDTNVC